MSNRKCGPWPQITRKLHFGEMPSIHVEAVGIREEPVWKARSCGHGRQRVTENMECVHVWLHGVSVCVRLHLLVL